MTIRIKQYQLKLVYQQLRTSPHGCLRQLGYVIIYPAGRLNSQGIIRSQFFIRLVIDHSRVAIGATKRTILQKKISCNG